MRFGGSGWLFVFVSGFWWFLSILGVFWCFLVVLRDVKRYQRANNVGVKNILSWVKSLQNVTLFC